MRGVFIRTRSRVHPSRTHQQHPMAAQLSLLLTVCRVPGTVHVQDAVKSGNMFLIKDFLASDADPMARVGKKGNAVLRL